MISSRPPFDSRRDQPHPTGAEVPAAGCFEVVLERCDAAEAVTQRIAERRERLGGRVGRHRLPEQAVIDVAAGAMVHGRALLMRDLPEVAQQPQRGRFLKLRQLRERRVQRVDVAQVMDVVVERHRACVDPRLERIDGIGQWRQSMRRCRPLPSAGLEWQVCSRVCSKCEGFYAGRRRAARSSSADRREHA